MTVPSSGQRRTVRATPALCKQRRPTTHKAAQAPEQMRRRAAKCSQQSRLAVSAWCSFVSAELDGENSGSGCNAQIGSTTHGPSHSSMSLLLVAGHRAGNRIDALWMLKRYSGPMQHASL